MTALTSESRWRAAHGGAALRLDISAAAITCVYIIFIAHPLPGRSLAAGTASPCAPLDSCAAARLVPHLAPPPLAEDELDENDEAVDKDERELEVGGGVDGTDGLVLQWADLGGGLAELLEAPTICAPARPTQRGHAVVRGSEKWRERQGAAAHACAGMFAFDVSEPCTQWPAAPQQQHSLLLLSPARPAHPAARAKRAQRPTQRAGAPAARPRRRRTPGEEPLLVQNRRRIGGQHAHHEQLPERHRAPATRGAPRGARAVCSAARQSQKKKKRASSSF